MRGCVWATLLRCIPAEHHNILMVVTRCGTEIALQNVLRIDDEILAIRGRLAGSQDSGRLYFVPLDNIDYFGFNRMVKDEEYTAMFGNYQPPPLAAPAPVAPPVPAVVQSQAAVQPPEPESPEPEAAPEPALTPPPSAPLKPTLPIKSAVLERFRSRSAPTFNGSIPRPSE
jgi:hypothetical protein